MWDTVWDVQSEGKFPSDSSTNRACDRRSIACARDARAGETLGGCIVTAKDSYMAHGKILPGKPSVVQKI